MLLAAVVALSFAGAARAAELVMLQQPGCVWCARWDREIAPAYPKTAEGKRAPLRRVDITKPWPQDLAGVRLERLTPTFVLVEDGAEIARLRGYPGDEFFWFLLDQMLAKLP
jgi:thioredoxin-related protein